ncbi:MAG TPA: hypothetical protein VFU31_05485 [Candidatus Binatia bacterium]|nr:hypothetical protein [Candidatus Binatia bacterium]
MTQLSISFNNAELVRKGLQDLAAEVPKIGKLQIYRTEQTVVRRMKEYWTMNVPPELPSYQRTGTLAGGYFISPTTNGYRITNQVPYTKHVVGNAYGLEQAWMHAKPGRHKLLRDIQEEEVEKLPPLIEQEISMVARRVGL